MKSNTFRFGYQDENSVKEINIEFHVNKVINYYCILKLSRYQSLKYYFITIC